MMREKEKECEKVRRKKMVNEVGFEEDEEVSV